MKLSKIGGWKYTIKEGKAFWTDVVYSIHEIDAEKNDTESMNLIEESLKCYNEEDRPVVLEAFEKCCSEGTAYDLIFPFTTFKNNKKWIRTIAQALVVDNEIISVIGNIMDITESKNMETELAEYRSKLEELVKVRTETLEKKNAELEHFNELFVDREFRIKELRDRVKELEE